MLHFLPALILILLQGSASPDIVAWATAHPSSHASVVRILESSALEVIVLAAHAESGPASQTACEAFETCGEAAVAVETWISPANRLRDGPR